MLNCSRLVEQMNKCSVRAVCQIEIQFTYLEHIGELFFQEVILTKIIFPFIHSSDS